MLFVVRLRKFLVYFLKKVKENTRRKQNKKNFKKVKHEMDLNYVIPKLFSPLVFEL